MWIESHQALARHPKTLRLARLLGVGVPAAIGHLHLLWWWCIDYADDGDLGRFDPDEIAIAAEWPGDAAAFVAAMASAGFLDEGEGALSVHDWQHYGGKMAIRRRANAERMRNSRAQHVPRTDEPRAASVQSERREEKRTEENRTEEDRTNDAGAAAPPANVTPISKNRRGTKTPERFELEEAHLALAATLGFGRDEAADETARFLDWHRAKGSTLVDWDSAWRNWMRKAKDIRGERRPARRSAEEYAAAFDRLMDAAALAATFEVAP